MQVKIFGYTWESADLESKINNWIIQNQSLIEVKDIRINFHDQRYTGYIVYENRPVLKEEVTPSGFESNRSTFAFPM